MAFINSQDPGPPRATVHICYSLKTMAFTNYSNLKAQLHFHSLALHLRLTQSYMASRITRKYPNETHLTLNLAFFFFSKSDLHITSSSATNSSGQWKKISRKNFLTWSCYCHVTCWAGEPEWTTENSFMLWTCCHYPREDISRWYRQVLQITVI